MRADLFVHYNDRNDTVFYLENLPTNRATIDFLKGTKSPLSSKIPINNPDRG